MTRDRLKTKASNKMRNRNHAPGQWRNTSVYMASTRCYLCGDEAVVNAQAGKQEMGGDALNGPCSSPRRETAVRSLTGSVSAGARAKVT